LKWYLTIGVKKRMSNPYNALSVQGLRGMRKLSSSPAITVTVNTIQTYFYNFAMSPLSGNAPFTINFQGYLSDYSNAVGDLSALNGETITIQQLIGGVWTNTGVTAVTATSGTSPGYFSGSLQITLAAYPPGQYQFRANYAGNTTKGLFSATGTPTQAGVNTPASKPSALPGIVLGAATVVAVAMIVA
jgi:hypothetical protein